MLVRPLDCKPQYAGAQSRPAPVGLKLRFVLGVSSQRPADAHGKNLAVFLKSMVCRYKGLARNSLICMLYWESRAGLGRTGGLGSFVSQCASSGRSSSSCGEL